MRPLSLVLVGVAALAAADPSTRGPLLPSTASPTLIQAVERLAPDSPELLFLGEVARMQAAGEAVVDATYTFHKIQYVGGGLLPEELMAVKFRKPLDVYMKWVGEVDTGQEMIYRQGWNEGKMRINPGPFLPNINLATDSAIAARTNRKTVDWLPFTRVITQFIAEADAMAAAMTGPSVVELLEPRLVHGERARCYHLELPKDRIASLYAYRVDLCISDRTDLPIRIQAWDIEDGTLQLVEDYGYEGVQLNVGLTDADFDPDNKAYGF